jgi:hypothetical protein
LRLTGFEQGQRSWAKAIRSVSEVPPAYASFFEALGTSDSVFPTTVLTPSYEGFLHPEPERVLCAMPEEILVLTPGNGGLEVVRYPYARADYVEMSIVLLEGRLVICGTEAGGAHSLTRFRFNAVTDYLFAPIVDRVRRGGLPPRPIGDGPASDAFLGWGTTSYKFMNYARRSLLGDEAIQHAFFQPEIRGRVLSALGRTYSRTLGPALATILTDRELILIREGPVRRNRDRYGATWDYLRLGAIESVGITEAGRGLLKLSIGPHRSAPLEFLYAASARGDLETLMQALRDLRTG